MNDYPTEKELKTIENWDYKDPIGLINFISPYFEENGWIKITGKKIINLQISTGGWSGCESIIQALQNHKNLFFPLYWLKSERGGHYWFKITPIKKSI